MLRPLCVRILFCVVFHFASFSFSHDFVFLPFSRTNVKRTGAPRFLSSAPVSVHIPHARFSLLFCFFLFLFFFFSFHLTPLLHPSRISCPVTSTPFFCLAFPIPLPPRGRIFVLALGSSLFFLPAFNAYVALCPFRVVGVASFYCIYSPVSFSLRTRCSRRRRRRRRGLRYLTRFSTHVNALSLIFPRALSLPRVLVVAAAACARARSPARFPPLLRDIFRFPFRYVRPVSDT